MRVTQRLEFECCYISNRKLNAHRYRIEVTVSGEDRYLEDGVVIEFTKFREYIQHVVPAGKFVVGKFGYSGESEELAVRDVSRAMANCGILTQEYAEASCERMCEEIAHQLQQEFYIAEPGLIVEEVKLREDSQSFAVWTNSDN